MYYFVNLSNRSREVDNVEKKMHPESAPRNWCVDGCPPIYHARKPNRPPHPNVEKNGNLWMKFPAWKLVSIFWWDSKIPPISGVASLWTFGWFLPSEGVVLHTGGTLSTEITYLSTVPGKRRAFVLFFTTYMWGYSWGDCLDKNPGSTRSLDFPLQASRSLQPVR